MCCVEETLGEPVAGSRCVSGHDQPRSPARHPELGLVPSRTSTWFGAVIVGLLVGLVWWLADSLRPWIVAGLGGWWVVTLLVQVALGHRGACAVRRTGRWFFGPAGALLDPFDGD
jgi:hypothetical protein